MGDPKLVNFNVPVPADLGEQVRDCAYWDRTTIIEFCVAAMRAELAKRVRKNGKPYPSRGDVETRGRRAH